MVWRLPNLLQGLDQNLARQMLERCRAVIGSAIVQGYIRLLVAGGVGENVEDEDEFLKLWEMTIQKMR